jgi:Xaa-Pro aminopeptidase
MPTEVLADEAALRSARRARAFAQMEAHDVDVLLLGREANARYIAGAQRLWTAGTRPFGPGCVVVRATGAIHLVSTWDEGIPEDIPHENLFGITWNPGNMQSWLRGIAGVEDARRIGTDSLTPRFGQRLPKLFPSAEFVDAEPLLDAARRIKTPEEVGAIRHALAVAEIALAAAVDGLTPGTSERHLAALFMEAMAGQGVTTPATQRVAWVSSDPGAHGRRKGNTIEPEDLVVFDAGVVAAGYVGELGRTWPASDTAVDPSTRSLHARAEALWERLLDACRVGAPCAGLLDAYEAEEQKLPQTPVGFGLGLGFDVPVVTGQLHKTAAREHFEPGMVLAVTARVSDEHHRTVVRKDAVLIGDGGPDVLSKSPCWHP